MEYIDELVELLDEYISRDEVQAELYLKKRADISLYEELMAYFALPLEEIKQNSIAIDILLDTIYNNDISAKFYDYLYKNIDDYDELNAFIAMIKNDYQKVIKQSVALSKAIHERKYYISSARMTKLAIKKKINITGKFDINNVMGILNYFQVEGKISKKEELFFINEIEHYNRLTAAADNPKEKEYAEEIYKEIPNILNAGFEELPNVQISFDKKNALQKTIDEILRYEDSVSDEELIEIIETYKKYNLEDNEFNYIIVKIMGRYIDDMLEYYSMLLDKEIYSRRAEREEIKRSYYGILKKYVALRKYYYELNEVTPTDDNVNEEETKQQKIFIYSHGNNNSTTPSILNDLDDVRMEDYEHIGELLSQFKNGSIPLGKVKRLSSNLSRSLSEIKDDQTRIIIKHVRDNIYNICGVFIKKDNNDVKMYRKISSRPVPSVNTAKELDTELKISKYTENKIEELIIVKGRKNTR